MDLTNLIKNIDVEEELIYNRNGQKCTANPKIDCSIDLNADEVDELRKMPSYYYYYGCIASDVTDAREIAEDELSGAKDILSDRLAVRKSQVYLLEEQKLRQRDARCTDKVLESLINVDKEVIEIRDQLTKLSDAKRKVIKLKNCEMRMKIILKALLIKQDDLIEISRRKKLEYKSYGNL